MDDGQVSQSVAGSASGDVALGSGETGDGSATLDEVYSVLCEIRDQGVTASVDGASSVVTLDPSQYDRFSALGGAGLQVDVLTAGVLALVLGAVIATAMTVHWRGSRG